MAAEAEVQEVTDRRCGHPIQQASTGQPVPEQGYRNQIPPSPLLSSKRSMRVTKFDGHDQQHLYSSRFQTFLTARGLIETFEPTRKTIRIVGGLTGMEDRNRSINLHGWAAES